MFEHRLHEAYVSIKCSKTSCVCVYLHISVVLHRQVEDLAWVVVKTADDVIQSKTSIADGGQQQRQHRLQAGVTWRRTITVLLLNRVGG